MPGRMQGMMRMNSRPKLLHLRSDMVEDGQQDAVKDAGPEGGGEGHAVEFERVKQHLQPPHQTPFMLISQILGSFITAGGSQK